MISRIRGKIASWADTLGLIDSYVRKAQRENPNSLIVLMYHRVIDHADPMFVGIPVKQFEEQMKYISDRWNPVSEQQVVNFYRHGKPLPEGAVFVTFDDGYKDAYTLALPVLRKHRIPAILFVSSDPVDNNDLLWTDELSLLLKHTNRTSLDLFIEKERLRLDLSSDRAKTYALFEIKSRLKRVADSIRHETLEGVRGQLGELSSEQRSGYLVSREDMQELYQAGVCIGAHTVTHPILSQVTDDKAREEIAQSRDYLLEMGFPQISFCYPNGQRADYNESTKSIVKECGFDLAFTAVEGANDENTHPLELQRLHVSNVPAAALKYRFARSLIALNND